MSESSESKKEPLNAQNLVGIFRLGGVQLVVTLTGEGHMRRPVARIVKAATDPRSTTSVWEMEDLAALSSLAKAVTDQMLLAQSIVPSQEMEPLGDAEEDDK